MRSSCIARWSARPITFFAALKVAGDRPRGSIERNISVTWPGVSLVSRIFPSDGIDVEAEKSKVGDLGPLGYGARQHDVLPPLQVARHGVVLPGDRDPVTRKKSPSTLLV